MLAISRRQFCSGFVAASALAIHPGLAAEERVPGTFYPTMPDVRLGADGRTMTLLVDFEYFDLRRDYWIAPKNFSVDGASIPQVFWSYIGGPFEGLYRNASIIHDFYCEKRSRPSDAVHAVFYEAMLRSGVDPVQAWIMFAAVNTFGPSWRVDPPVGCITDDGEINMEKCIQNSGEIPSLEPATEVTADTMSVFIKGIEQPGFELEIERLKSSLPPNLATP